MDNPLRGTTGRSLTLKTIVSFIFSISLLTACAPNSQSTGHIPLFAGISASATPTLEPTTVPTEVPIPPVPTLVGTAAPSLPSTAFQNKVYQKGSAYIFEYTDPTTTIRYTYLPATGSLHDLSVRINNGALFYPSYYGGPYFVEGSSEIPIWQASPTFQISSSQPVLDANSLKITWKATSGKHTIIYNYQFSISGKSLRMDISSDTSDISKFSFDRSERTTAARIISLPYLTTINLLLFNDQYFMSTYFDWTQSAATDFVKLKDSYSDQSAYFGQVAEYAPNTDHVRTPIHETAFITVSDSLREVLPTIPNPPSPYREELAGRVVLDLWGDPFLKDADLLNQLRHLGMINNLLVIKHEWQKCGYDNCYPSVMPANPDMGGNSDLIQLSDTARQAGYLFALHENYVDIYPNSDLWNPNLIALDSNGNQIPAWYNPTTQMQSYRLPPASALDIAVQFSPQIHHFYGTTAVYLDASTGGAPWDFEDYNAKRDGSAQEITTFQAYSQLLAYERRVHNGPVLGEGDNHFMYAGLVDGVEAQFADLDYAPIQPVVDFDLYKIHPLAVNHGMGYYERFFGTAGNAYQQKFDFSDFNPEGFYTYMSTEIAFCHAGFVSSPDRLGVLQWYAQVNREVTLVLPIQKHCALAQPTQILYNVDGNLVGVEQALIKNQAWQVFVSWDSGLQVYVNRDASRTWNVTPASSQSWVDYRALVNGAPSDYVGNQALPSYVLPPNGWLAFLP